MKAWKYGCALSVQAFQVAAELKAKHASVLKTEHVLRGTLPPSLLEPVKQAVQSLSPTLPLPGNTEALGRAGRCCSQEVWSCSVIVVIVMVVSRGFVFHESVFCSLLGGRGSRFRDWMSQAWEFWRLRHINLLAMRILGRSLTTNGAFECCRIIGGSLLDLVGCDEGCGGLGEREPIVVRQVVLLQSD